MKEIYLISLLLLGCATTTDGPKIEYTCKEGHKITCPKNKCEEFCRKYESYDDPNVIQRKTSSENPFILDQTEEQVIFGHGN